MPVRCDNCWLSILIYYLTDPVLQTSQNTDLIDDREAYKEEALSSPVLKGRGHRDGGAEDDEAGRHRAVKVAVLFAIDAGEEIRRHVPTGNRLQTDKSRDGVRFGAHAQSRNNLCEVSSRQSVLHIRFLQMILANSNDHC